MKVFKILAGTALLLAFSAQISAQIKINDYEKKQVSFVDEVDDLDPVTATSSCGEVHVEIKERIFSGGCLGTLVRTYTFTDDCGETAEAEQYISQKDNTAPTFASFDKNVTIASNDDLANIAELIATDNSGEMPKVEMTEVEQKNGVVRTYTATDKCGNSSTASQTISYESL